MENLLEVKNLKTQFITYAGRVSALNNVSFDVKYGEAVGIVGESGSGKSVAMLSIMKLLPNNGRAAGGEIFFNGRNIEGFSDKEMQDIRGNEMGMIFQEPMTSLNPVFTVGYQLAEAVRKHKKLSKAAAWQKATELLKLVGIPDPERRIRQYPHEFSGGMCQRAMIAMALSCEPKLLIADEPTTALDVTVQAQIMELIKELKEKANTSIILITHDFGLVADICERVFIMYGGTIVEQAETHEIFENPRHPYTRGLLDSIPGGDREKERLRPIEGQPPDMVNLPAGCPFLERCPHAMEVCNLRKPPYMEVSDGHSAACWLLYARNGGVSI